MEIASKADSEVSSLKFKYPWRPYQARVLDAVDKHLTDDKLHIVAAPGSGKTTLGLEVFRRLARPALVLSPTRTIRDQWVLRLRDFVAEGQAWPLSWVSTDLDAPEFFTSITYQALHTKYRQAKEDRAALDEEQELIEEEEGLGEALDKSEIDHFVEQIRSANIGTLILDEAHHLRVEWWKALSEVLESVTDIKLVSLTATPPYDVSGHEWNRYHELCGSIDEEISVPELVRSGTLCPHQDYVWTVVPLKNERELVREYDESVTKICDDLFEDVRFQGAVERHPWLQGSEIDESEILDKPELAVALLVYQKAKKSELPSILLQAMDLEAPDIPDLSRRWWQVLIKGFLFDNSWTMSEEDEEYRTLTAQHLRAKHLLWRRELRLTESRLVKSHLTLSSAKIRACVNIHRVERRLRGEGLRQVILTDFIRDKEFDKPVAADEQPLGAWPIFRALLMKLGPERSRDIVLLTGRLVVVHEQALGELQQMVGADAVTVSPLVTFPGFYRISARGNVLVTAVTTLLMKGVVRTLVGTRALLGEGWDAPAINSLVLASFVGSYMLTNQMRGRAIRIDKQNPDKASSIWHIVAIAPRIESGLMDLRELYRRFDTFVGLDEKKPIIENGLKRLRLLHFHQLLDLSHLYLKFFSNSRYAIRRLRNIDRLAHRWQEAIEMGEAHQVVPTVEAEKPITVSPFHFKKTLKYLLWEMLGTFMMVFGYGMSSMSFEAKDNTEAFVLIGFAILISGIIGAIAVLPKLIKAIIIWARHLPVDGTVRQMAMAVRDSLCEADFILGSPGRYPVRSIVFDDGSVSLSLGTGSFYEKSLFADCMEELLGEIGNPRYLITRRKMKKSMGRMDYHAVPQILGQKKEFANIFKEAWERRIGPTDLIYARGEEGRKILLKARSRAFSTAMKEKTFRKDRWQ